MIIKSSINHGKDCKRKNEFARNFKISKALVYDTVPLPLRNDDFWRVALELIVLIERTEVVELVELTEKIVLVERVELVKLAELVELA